MPKFKWEGLTKEGKKTSGEIDARSDKDVKRNLRSQGIRATKVTAPSILEFDINEWLVDKGIAQTYGPNELGLFTKQLAIMINAGVPILQSLEILQKQEKNPSFRKAIKSISEGVASGKTIYESMADQKGFSKLYVNLVKAGEAGGILDDILNRLAAYMEKQEKIKQTIKSAMTYPAIVCVIGIGVISAMMVFVVPMFVEMLKDSGQQIPWITQLVIDISNFMKEWVLILIPIIVALFVLFTRFIKTPEGKPIWDRFIMKTPLFGNLVIKGNLTSFTRTLSTLLAAGVPLLDALEICIDILDNGVVAKDLRKVRSAVSEGKTLTEPLARIKYFPEMVAQMMKIGESTGNLDTMLVKVAEIFERETEELIHTITKLIEPLVLVVLGGAVAVIMIAMYLPIFMSGGGDDDGGGGNAADKIN
ncbi:MAG: type II secretion system F family protein [Bacteriovoracaceae bacterium]